MSYYLEEEDLIKLLKRLNYAPREAVTSEGEHQRAQEWLRHPRSKGGSVILRWQRKSLEPSSPEYNEYILVQVGKTLEVLASLERMETVLLVAMALAHHIAPVGSISPDHATHARTEATRIHRPALVKLLAQLGWKSDAEVVTPDTRTQRWWKGQPPTPSIELTWKLVADPYDFTDWEFQYTHSIEYIADAEGCTVDELVALAYAHHLERWGRFVQLRTTKKGFQATFMRERQINHEYWGPSHPSPGKALRELGKEFDMKLAGDSFRAQR